MAPRSLGPWRQWWILQLSIPTVAIKQLQLIKFIQNIKTVKQFKINMSLCFLEILWRKIILRPAKSTTLNKTRYNMLFLLKRLQIHCLI